VDTGGSVEEKIYFGGGCFWCTEAVFQNLRGVMSVTPGYSGGTKTKRSYSDVSGGDTGHAEVVEVVYNPKEIAFSDLLTIFFATHDPTSLNKQGADVGTQYRSAIFYTNEEQKKMAEKFLEDINNSSTGGKKVVTEIAQFRAFYEASEEHKEYYRKNSRNSYCQLVINPKLEKVQKNFSELLKSQGS